MEAFQSAEVERITGVKNKRLWAWIDRGFIQPSIQQAEGPGQRNVWGRNDLYTIALLKKLTESGWVKKLLPDFMKIGYIPKEYDIDRITYLFLVKAGGKIDASLVQSDTMDIDIPRLVSGLGMENFDTIFLINFKKIKEEVDSKI